MDELNVLRQRLYRLERQVRCWMIVGGSAVLAFALVLLVGATSSTIPDEIRAKRFLVLDDKGTLRAELGMDSSAAPALKLYEAHGWIAAKLELSPDGAPSLRLGDIAKAITLHVGSEGQMALQFFRYPQSPIQLILGQDGTPVFSLLGNDDKSRVLLQVPSNGAPSLMLFDKEAKVRAELDLGMDADGTPRLRLTDKDEKARVAVVGGDLPGLWLADGNGQTRAMVTNFRDGPAIALFDANSNERVGLGLREGKSALVFRDTNGKVRAFFGSLPEYGPQLFLLDPTGKTLYSKP